MGQYLSGLQIQSSTLLVYHSDHTLFKFPRHLQANRQLYQQHGMPCTKPYVYQLKATIANLLPCWTVLYRSFGGSESFAILRPYCDQFHQQGPEKRTIASLGVHPQGAVRPGLTMKDLFDRSSRSDIHTLIEPGSSAPSHLNAGANPSSSTPYNHLVETQIGSALSRQGAEGSQEDTGETETEAAPLSNVNERLPTTVSRPQFPPEPQERLGSTSSNQLLGNVTATTDSASSGTSAAAETSLSSVSSVSDQRGQQQALSFRDGRRRPLENSPAEDEADLTELSTEVEEVVPHKGPTTGGVSIIILGFNFPSAPLYIRFGGFITRTVSEALGWLGDWSDRLAVDLAERSYSAMHSSPSISTRQSQSHFVPGAVSQLS